VHVFGRKNNYILIEMNKKEKYLLKKKKKHHNVDLEMEFKFMQKDIFIQHTVSFMEDMVITTFLHHPIHKGNLFTITIFKHKHHTKLKYIYVSTDQSS
jgi:hypothetical protein